MRLSSIVFNTLLTWHDSFWVGDEYGAYIYRFDSNGNLIQTIQPPPAIVPVIDGRVNFTSVSGPDTGRVGNQGACLTNVPPSLFEVYLSAMQVSNVSL